MYDKYGWQRLATEAPSPRFRSPLIRPWHKGIPLYSTFALLLPHLWSHFGKYIAVPVSLLGWAETLGLSLNSGKVAGSQLWSNEYVTDKETIRNYFSKIEGRPSILKKKTESNELFLDLKHSEYGLNFFHTFLTYTKFTFCKNIGQKRPTQPSAVVWRKHCRVYGVTTAN